MEGKKKTKSHSFIWNHLSSPKKKIWTTDNQYEVRGKESEKKNDGFSQRLQSYDTRNAYVFFHSLLSSGRCIWSVISLIC